MQTPEGETIFGLGIQPDYDDPTARQESRPTGPPTEPPPQQPAREPEPAEGSEESEPLFPGGVPPFKYPETAQTAIGGRPDFGLEATVEAQAPTEPPPAAVQPYILTAEDRAEAMRMLEEDFARENSYLNLGKKPTHSGSGNRKKRAINRFYNESLAEYQSAERSRQQFQQEETQFRRRSDEDLQRARREQQAREHSPIVIHYKIY